MKFEKITKDFNAKILEYEQKLKENQIKLDGYLKLIRENKEKIEESDKKLKETLLKSQISDKKLKKNDDFSRKKNEDFEKKFKEIQKKNEDFEKKNKENFLEIQRLKASKSKIREEFLINKETYDQMIRTLSDTVTTQCDDIYNLMQINEKLEGNLHEKDEELKNFLGKINEKDEELKNLTIEFEFLQKNAIFQPKDFEVKFEAERMSFSIEMTQMKRNLEDLTEKNYHFSEENRRLNEKLSEKHMELNELKKEINENEELEKMKRINDNLKVELIELKEKNMRFNAEKNENVISYQRILRENENSSIELKEAYEIIDTLKENNKNNWEIAGMNEKIKGLMMRNQGLEEDSLINRENYERFARENESLKGEVMILKEKLRNKENEFFMKKEEFNEKIGELNEVHKKYDVAINVFENENRMSVLKKSAGKKEFY